MDQSNRSIDDEPFTQNSYDDEQVRQSTQEILDLGTQASQLLNSPIYNTLYNLRLQQMFGEWMATVPKEEKRRESLYHEAKGLIEITQKMDGLVEEANRLLEEQRLANDPKERERKAMDSQGFGPVN